MQYIFLTMLMMGVLSSAFATDTSIDDINDLCGILKQNPQWHEAAKKSQVKWGISIATLMAFIHQESGFGTQSAKGFHGYAQSTKEIWKVYQKETGTTKSPDDFAAATDFIGWYSDKAIKKFGIKPTDTFTIYLVYQQGLGSKDLSSYQKNSTSTSIARKVVKQAKKFEQQLHQCKNK